MNMFTEEREKLTLHQRGSLKRPDWIQRNSTADIEVEIQIDLNDTPTPSK